MAISTQGDIVLDVMRAADPAAAGAARARLASFSGRAPEAGFSVAATADGTQAAGKGPAPEAFAKFEAMVLQTFLQSMLPTDTESVYGGGTAGEMWQAMLAEQLGAVMAERGGIGIADRILRDHYVVDGEKVAVEALPSDPARPAREAQRMLSLAMVQEIRHRLTSSLGGETAATTGVTA